jgi:hypothetical protein
MAAAAISSRLCAGFGPRAGRSGSIQTTGEIPVPVSISLLIVAHHI